MKNHNKCRDCWNETRHQIINRTMQMGLHARRASVLIDKTIAGYDEIITHLDSIVEKAREVDSFFKTHKKGAL